MGRKVKCQITGEYGDSNEFVKINNKYYKSQTIYDDYQKESSMRKETLDFILMNILDYQSNAISPSIVVKKLNELHENYSYDIILQTFKIKYGAIMQAINNKSFSSQYHKITYIFAIVINNIDDVSRDVKNKRQSNLSNTEAEHLADLLNHAEMSKVTLKPKQKDISKFVEEELL